MRVVFDQDRIILGVTCFDSEPDRLLGNQMQRDQPFSADDRFMWSIDPFLDGRYGLLLRDQPVGRDGRRPDHRSRPAAAGSAGR